MNNKYRYLVYLNKYNQKRAKPAGIIYSDVESAIASANRFKSNWSHLYIRVRVKDTETNKYIYEA